MKVDKMSIVNLSRSRKRRQNQTGNAAGVLLAVVSLTVIGGAIIGLVANRQAFIGTTEALINGQVRLVSMASADPGCTNRVTKTDNNQITVCGRVCFGQNYQSG